VIKYHSSFSTVKCEMLISSCELIALVCVQIFPFSFSLKEHREVLSNKLATRILQHCHSCQLIEIHLTFFVHVFFLYHGISQDLAILNHDSQSQTTR
jgi:hypothetical protein